LGECSPPGKSPPEKSSPRDGSCSAYSSASRPSDRRTCSSVIMRAIRRQRSICCSISCSSMTQSKSGQEPELKNVVKPTRVPNAVRALEDLPDPFAVAQHVAGWAIGAVGRLLHRPIVGGREDVLLLDDDSARLGELVDAVQFHPTLRVELGLIDAHASAAAGNEKRR